jgi:GNAT superfamily N-acetyltransferase
MASLHHHHLLANLPGAALDDACRIYEASIPASERKPVGAVRAMAADPDYQLIGALADRRLVGFAAVFAPRDEPFALLEYLAVDEGSRGGGVGARLFRAAVDAQPDRYGALLVEVESEDGDAGGRALRRRRQTFYRRLGCRRVAGLAYELPLRTAGPPPPMNLFVHSGGSPPRTLARAQLTRALRTTYARVYGQPATDPRIERMVGGLSDPVAFD